MVPCMSAVPNSPIWHDLPSTSMSELEDFRTFQLHSCPEPCPHGLLVKSFSFTHDLYFTGWPFLIMDAYWGGSPVQVTTCVICQSPVFAFNGCTSPAAVARGAATHTIPTAITFLMSALLRGFKSNRRYRDLHKSQSISNPESPRGELHHKGGSATFVFH